MTTWTQIFPDVDGDPVRGEPAEFDAAAAVFDDMGTAASEILEQFERIRDEAAVDQMQGEAADAFRTLIDNVAGSLADLPAVCADAFDALDRHRRDLEALQDQADSALARARTRWDEHEDAERALSSRRASSDRLARQLDDLPPAGADPTTDGERTSLEGDADAAAGALSAAEGALDNAAADLAASRQDWSDLRDDEDQLNQRTADALDDISLGDLEDPSWWESILGSAFDLLMDLTGLDALLDLLEAIVTGDWAAALWALRELLDRVLMVVAVIALFTPLGPLVLALAAIKLATSLALYATQWPNPETGQTVGLLDVALDAADVLGAAGEVAMAARYVKAAGAAPPVGAATPPSGAVPTNAATPPASSAVGNPSSGVPSGRPRVLRDGEGSTPADIAASTGGPTGGSRRGQAAARRRLLEREGNGPYTCWRCGGQTTNPANMHLGHRNVPTSRGGNLSDENISLEGAACNLSAGNRGAPSSGMSCIERGSPGAPYGRTD